MRRNSPRSDWFFPIEEAPVLVSVTHKGVARDVRVPHKKALIAASRPGFSVASHLDSLSKSAAAGSFIRR
jgi:hypothetical protein